MKIIKVKIRNIIMLLIPFSGVLFCRIFIWFLCFMFGFNFNELAIDLKVGLAIVIGGLVLIISAFIMQSLTDPKEV